MAVADPAPSTRPPSQRFRDYAHKAFLLALASLASFRGRVRATSRRGFVAATLEASLPDRARATPHGARRLARTPGKSAPAVQGEPGRPTSWFPSHAAPTSRAPQRS